MAWPFRGTNKSKFQIMSDLHLEMGQQYASFEIKACAPYLILAGDIGRLVDYNAFCAFLQVQCRQFVKVFLVLGNHEFFGLPRTQGSLLADRLENEKGLKGVLLVMNRKRIDLAGVTILGCTLQSHIPDHANVIVSQKINDFSRIGDWTVADHNAEHTKDVTWLSNEISSIRQVKDASRRKILIVTHHAPAVKGTSAPANESNPWSSAFSTDLLDNSNGSPLNDVQWWVFGHTHYCSESLRGSVRLVSNQRGYVFPEAETTRSSLNLSCLAKLRRFIACRKELDVAFNPKKVIRL